MTENEEWLAVAESAFSDWESEQDAILDSIGITINWTGLPSTPKYLLLRDDLDAMCWLRRWLSFRMRREFEQVGHQNRMELLDATLTAGDERVEYAGCSTWVTED